MLSDKLCQPINDTTKLNRATSPLRRVVDLEKRIGYFYVLTNQQMREGEIIG